MYILFFLSLPIPKRDWVLAKEQVLFAATPSYIPPGTSHSLNPKSALGTMALVDSIVFHLQLEALESLATQCPSFIL